MRAVSAAMEKVSKVEKSRAEHGWAWAGMISSSVFSSVEKDGAGLVL
jgi:hypothetical protein